MNIKQTHVLYGVILILIIISSYFGYLAFYSTPATTEVDDVSILLAWLFQGKHAWWFTTIEKGFFAEEHISAQILRGYGSVTTAEAIAEGKYDFGYTMLTPYLQVKDQGGDMMAVALIGQRSGDCWVSFKEKNIVEPKDAEGHSFAYIPGSSDALYVPIFCEYGGIDINKIEKVSMQVGTAISALFSGTVDISPALVGSLLTTAQHQSKAIGKELNVINWYDYGVDLVGHVLCCNNKLINEKPDLIRRFLRALVKGMEYADKHPEEAFEILLKYRPELGGASYNITRDQWYEWHNFQDKTDYTEEHGWFTFPKENIEFTLNVTVDIYGTQRFPLEEIYTDEFLITRPYPF